MLEKTNEPPIDDNDQWRRTKTLMEENDQTLFAKSDPLFVKSGQALMKSARR